ncbi:GGDEF domain-containing protein [Fusibacter sp. 3D3]|uniref:GGDEF domain-containing protein n=1 Tax=Fusibacter sp. 3D3 TaxID=1048380 RepID=UPI000852BF5F|nr:GGDEF domain-containing protein [Fusibacter sp. 3D3]GAU80064.1 sensory box/GGDEF family protein [Fusibacter sp. 3D3]
MNQKDVFLKRLKKSKPYITFLLIFTLIIFLAYLSPEKDLSIAKGNILDLNDNWQVSTDKISTDSSTSGHVELPYTIENVGYDQVFKVEKTLDEAFPDGMSLRIRASMQDVSVIAKNRIIYQSERTREGRLVFPEVSMWHLVELPDSMAGEVLTIEYKTKINTFLGVVNPIYYGEKEALIYDIVHKNITGLGVAVTMLITGVLAIIASIILSRIGDYRLLYLGLFSISASIWMMSEMRVLQLVTGNRFILGGISYLMLPLFTIALVRYLGIVVLEKYRWYTQIIVRLFFVLLFLSIVLQMTGRVPFIAITTITLILIGSVILGTLAVMSYESFVLKNKKSSLYLMHLSVLIVTGFLEIGVFFSKEFDLLNLYSKLGFGAFMAFQFIESIKYFNNLLVLKNESKLLEKMAYTDILTGGDNRAAFERDLDELLNRALGNTFRLALLDINNLKNINDTFGHSEGDLVIKRTYDAIQMAFSELGKCYRLGGDEFACLMEDVDPVKYNSAVAQLDRLLGKIEQELSYNFSIAIGHGVFSYIDHETNVDFGAFFHKVDLAMYEQKRAAKGQNKQIENQIS